VPARSPKAAARHLVESRRAVRGDYYAQLLELSGRLTLEARDCLAKYCAALAVTARTTRTTAPIVADAATTR